VSVLSHDEQDGPRRDRLDVREQRFATVADAGALRRPVVDDERFGRRR
jgi:hypothetical protein